MLNKIKKQLKINNGNSKGFTLIELLVVIAIIGILSTLSVVALMNARSKARDVKRYADMKQIRTALEMYYQDNSLYPTTWSYGEQGTGSWDRSNEDTDGDGTYLWIF